MKSTFQVVQHHAQKIQELLNTHGIDLETQMDPIEFAKAVDASTDEILKMRNLLKSFSLLLKAHGGLIVWIPLMLR